MTARARSLLAWYERAARDLPWRQTTDPYRILVSEVMLQQTQAHRVVPHYERFLARFPTVHALAAASLADVLAAWSGLGYNTRARRLREAARAITAHGWPTTASGLRALPGVGPYTAAAVASFAFGEQVAAADTNVRRVLSRWHGEPLTGRHLEEAAAGALGGDAAVWNQAMMELGATLCRPRSPRCGECPVSEWCADPSVYEAPPRQGRFEGSHRQVRAAVLRTLTAEWSPIADVSRAVGNDRPTVEEALDSLRRDGLVEVSDDRTRVPH